MQKPNGYDEAQAGGGYVPVELGGHYCKIKQVSEMKSSKGKDMIVVVYDFTAPDPQAEYFQDQFDNDTRDDKKWPFAGRKYIMVNDYNDEAKTSRQFKSFCTCIEDSNNYEIKWGGADWGKQFIGKKFGVVIGEEESEYDGNISMRRLPRWFCSWLKVPEQKIPNTKYLNKPVRITQQNNDDFLSVPEGVDEEIPF